VLGNCGIKDLMMAIPQHICDVLGCANDFDLAQLSAHLDGLPSLPWFLSDQEGRDLFCEAVFDETMRLIVEVHEVQDDVQSTRYLQITVAGIEFRSLLAIPHRTENEAVHPTAALLRLAKAWPANVDLVAVGEEGGVPPSIFGKVLVFSPAHDTAWDRKNLTQCLVSLLGYRLRSAYSLLDPPRWVGKTQFEMDEAALGPQSSMMAGQLLQEVLSENRARWRYVSFYRVFEAAYLVGLKETLLSDFLSRPKEALESAKSALESELATFQQLVVTKNLVTHFEHIRSSVDGDVSNRFLHAIKRALKDSGLSASKKGVAYAYKIRCAIVHAGQHDVVFDRFQDAEDGVRLLLPDLESAVLDLLGFKPI
jgi:hypothetical protein